MKRTSFGLQPIDQKLSDLLKPIFAGSKKEFILINNLTKNWSQIVGKKYENFCHPQSVKFSKADKMATLTIAVHNSAVGFFLEGNSEIILERIATLYGFKTINKIVIKQDPKQIGGELKKEIKLTKNQEELLQRQTKNITDQELANALQQLGSVILSEAKDLKS